MLQKNCFPVPAVNGVITELLYRLEDCNPDFIKWDFEHEDGFCKSAMTDNLDFMQNICINK